MRNIVVVFIFLCFYKVLAENVPEKGEESVKDLSAYNDEGWKAIQESPNNAFGWIPHEQSTQITKRRRLRKRKRRPSVTTSAPSITEVKLLTNGLSKIPEPWDEISDTKFSPYNRRRFSPVYDDELVAITANVNPLKASISFGTENGEHQDQRKEDILYGKLENNPNEKTKPSELKNLLKQNGGISLSEVLQKKNLSLAELLSGNRNVLSVLTEKSPDNPVDNPTKKETGIQQEIPSLVSVHTNVLNTNGDAFEKLSSKVHQENESLPPDDNFHPKLIKVMESTTEKIFVPLHPKFYTSLNFKQDLSQFKDSVTEPYNKGKTIPTTASTVRTYNRLHLKPKLKQNLPRTNAEDTTSKNKEKGNTIQGGLPQKAIKISMSDIFGFQDEIKESTKQSSTEDGPMKISIDIDQFFAKPVFAGTDTSLTMPPEAVTMETTTQSEKLQKITAKDEINEFLKDPADREKLSRILKIRNMTVQELVEQRERGSSQLHLADIFHNKTREPEPVGELFVGRISENNPQRKSKSLFNYTNTIQPTVSSTDTFTNEMSSVNTFATFKIELKKSGNQPSLPWKQLYPDLFDEVIHNNSIETTHVPSDNTEEYFHPTDEMENKFSDASIEKLNLDENYFENEIFHNLPSGVKSAILASLAIVGLSLIVFLTIFLIFRWVQKQRSKIIYSSQRSPSMKSPFFETSPISFKTFVSETLRRKQYYKTNIKNVTDSIWQNGKK